MTEVEGGGRQRGFITGGQADTSRDRSAPDQLVAYYPKRTVAATRHRVPQMCEFPDGFPQGTQSQPTLLSDCQAPVLYLLPLSYLQILQILSKQFTSFFPKLCV